MREQIFVTEIVNSLRACGAWAYKIPDQPTSWIAPQMRFTPQKPCDVIACLNGRFIGIECKQFRSWRAFSKKALRPAQVEGLDGLYSSGGLSFVFLNVRISREENRLIAFPWEELRGTEKSIYAKLLKDLPFVQGKNGLFDLGRVLGAVRSN